MCQEIPSLYDTTKFLLKAFYWESQSLLPYKHRLWVIVFLNKDLFILSLKTVF